jgi:transposase-like protein
MVNKGVKWLVTRRKTAMKNRKWEAKTKALIVMEGIKGKPVSEICAEHQLSQSQYYRWRDEFLANIHQVFGETDKRDERLLRENKRLKQIIGDLTVELKKTEELLK